MIRTLNVFSLLSIVLGVFWSTYAVANGYRSPVGDPSYFLPQALTFLVAGVVGWALFGSLGKILGRLERLEQTLPAGDWVGR